MTSLLFLTRQILNLSIRPQTFQYTGLVSMVTQQTRGMKVKTSIRKRCDGCYTMKRKGRYYIYCMKKKTHKQRQG